MLFPSGPFQEGVPRQWFLVPHDALYEQVKALHGGASKWSDQWSEGRIGPHLRAFLSDYELRAVLDTAPDISN